MNVCIKCSQFGSSGEMIYKTLCDSGLSIPCVRATNLEGAVNCARSMARSGLSSLYFIIIYVFC